MSYTVYFKTLANEIIDIKITHNTTIGEMKHIIATKSVMKGISENEFDIFFFGRECPEDKTAEDLKLTNSSVMYIVRRKK